MLLIFHLFYMKSQAEKCVTKNTSIKNIIIWNFPSLFVFLVPCFPLAKFLSITKKSESKKKRKRRFVLQTFVRRIFSLNFRMKLKLTFVCFKVENFRFSTKFLENLQVWSETFKKASNLSDFHGKFEFR